jgi:hypothetical protein
MPRRSRAWLRGLALALAAACATPSVAQETAALRQEFERLFQQQLRNPSDLTTTFRFAEIAAQLGELEAAIGALERMLYFNPNLPRVKLELGVLYFRLGSNGQARAYLVDAISGENVPADVRARVETFLAEVNRRDQPQQLSGFVQTGLRFQTNANAGPSDSTVRALGLEATLTERFRPAPDWNAFAVGAFRYVHDLETGRGDAIETTLQVYGTHQNRFRHLDIALAEVTVGPRLAIAPEAAPGVSVRPYLIGNRMLFGGEQYLWTAGGGAVLTVPAPLGVSVDLGTEYRHRRYSDHPDNFPTASQQNGNLWSGLASAVVPLPLDARLVVRAAYNDNASVQRFYSYRQVMLDAALPIEFQPPLPDIPRRWTLAPFVAWTATDYAAPNPVIDPRIARSDRELRYGVSLDMPLRENLGVAVQISHAEVDSNLPNYRTRNTAVTFGPTLRF